MLSLSTARSSLEEMLESLRRNDENETPRDLPPALPPRPKATSRARLPSAKRPLPSSSETDRTAAVQKEEMGGGRGNDFGAKKVKEMDTGESPYVVAASEETKRDQMLQKKDIAKVGNLPAGSASDDKMGSFFEKNICVWCRRHNGLWESGQIKSTSGEKASVLLLDGNVVTVPIQDLLPANPQILDGVDDLVQLSFLNEPSVLHNLQYRYLQDKIYSKVGPVLVAVNPFKDVQLCEIDLVSAYRHKLLDNPHVYAVADVAYNAMMTDEINQSIIISGESGAGKTEIAKIAMQYLATFSGGDGVGSKVLQTSCIMEAFGNAKTGRNDNSTRFGKLTEIHFTATGQICGAKVQAFLLEKSRVVQLAEGERSYHIFYQLCSGAPSGLRGRLRLKKASDYNYLNQSNCLEINNVDDAQRFHLLMGALNSIRISKQDQENVFEMLAAILWLGNISFVVTDKQNHIEVVSDEAVTNAASLLGCSELALILALSTRKVQAGRDEVTKTLTLGQAIGTRDALAKFIYASLFDWLVETINFSLSAGMHNMGHSISVLDIYGFESFKKNSFEQFCINYANERIHQHFNQHLFKLEQGEYKVDGIDWRKVDFEDNQGCLDLFEKKPNGLISLLDEVSKFPKATDSTLATKLKQYLNCDNYFKGEKGGTFSIRHSAGEVIYDTEKFLEKNRDPVHSEIFELLSSCTGQLPQHFASTVLKQSKSVKSTLMQPGVLSECQKKSVATKFKEQLYKLLQHLDSTSPHFIHCIRPNNKQIPGSFEKDLVLQQLRCCGIPEVAKISRFGYPTRMTHQEFTKRYGFLLPVATCQDPLSMSISVLHQFGILPEMYQVGHSKLYFRNGAIGVLEDVRKQVLQGTLEVQKCFHGHHARPDFYKLKESVVLLQSFVRGEIARKVYGSLRKPDEQFMKVVLIQSAIRGWLARRHFSRLRSSTRIYIYKPKQARRTSDVKDLPSEMLPSVIEELQRRVSLAEVALEQKEKENLALREQVQQYKSRWSEYESKMKSMEEMWQKQMTSLQMSLAAAKKNLVDNAIGQPGRLDGPQSPRFYDSEDMSMGTQTPGGSTPVRYVNNCMDDVLSRDTNGGLNPVSHLVKEFEQTKHNFDDEARAIIEVKSGAQSPSLNPIEDFRRLKHKFEAWKKDYKARLREAKSKVYRLGRGDAEKHRRRWWGKKSKRS